MERGGMSVEILKDLYFGNIQPVGRAVKESGSYHKLEKEVRALEAALRSELSTEGNQRFDAFHRKQGEMIQISDCGSFIKGFRLGMRLLYAGLWGDYDSPLPQITDLQE